jgi:Flp pilus assembly pilin Flp
MALSCHRWTHTGYCIDSLGGTRIALPANTGGTSLTICNRGKKLLSYSEERSAKEEPVSKFLRQLWSDDEGQDIAEYAVMLAVILVIVVGTIRLIGTNANTVFSQVGSAIP